MRVCVFGLWHQGSVTAACLAKLGHKVVGLDFDKRVVRGFEGSKAPLFEPGLNELIARQTKAGRLTFSFDAREALKRAQVLWVAFDTPVNDDDVADILFLENNFKKIMPYLNEGTGIVFSSQAPVGFVARMEKRFAKECPGKKCYFASVPENLRLGKSLDAFLNPDRLVIGVRDQEARSIFAPLFSSITDKLEWMGIESAEMTKHAINSFLAMSVCFANELACICERTGANAKDVVRGLKTESRVGPKAYLSPGTAFSGGTLARDINFLIKLSDTHQLPAHLIRSVSDSNAFHKKWVERKCRQSLGSLKKKTVAILGLTYKTGTDTLRRSFAVELARSLHAQGAKVTGFDPVVKNIPKFLSKVIGVKMNIKEAVEHADAVVIAVEWPEFLQIDESLIKNKTIIDPNGFLVKTVEHMGLNYISVGGQR